MIRLQSGTRAVQLAMHQLMMLLTSVVTLVRFFMVPAFLAGLTGSALASTRTATGLFLLIAAISLLLLAMDALCGLVGIVVQVVRARSIQPLRDILIGAPPAPSCVRDDSAVKRLKRRAMSMAGITLVVITICSAFRSAVLSDVTAFAVVVLIMGTSWCVLAWLTLLDRRMFQFEMTNSSGHDWSRSEGAPL